MEGLVREMQDTEHGGVPVRSQKLFLTSIPAAFMGKRSLRPVMGAVTFAGKFRRFRIRVLRDTCLDARELNSFFPGITLAGDGEVEEIFDAVQGGDLRRILSSSQQSNI